MIKKNNLMPGPYQNKLETTLAALLEEVESVRPHFNLGQIFRSQSEALKDLGFFSVFTLYDRKSREITIKSFICCDGYSRKKIVPLIDRSMPIGQCSRYIGVLKKKQPIFIADSLGHLATIWPDINQVYKKDEKLNSVILALATKQGIIGFLEVFSHKLEKKDLEIFENFVKKLSIRLSNVILFQAVEKSEEKYRGLFEKAREGFLIFNALQDRIIDANVRFCQLFGLSRVKLEKMTFSELFPVSESAKVRDFVSSILKMDRNKAIVPQKLLVAIKTKKGGTKYLNIRIIRYINKEELFLMARDITERTKAEQALSESEEKYRDLVDNSTEAVIVVSPEGRITFANPAFRRIFGYPENEIKRKHFSHLVQSDDYNLTVASLDNVFSGQIKSMRLEIRMLDREKREKFIISSGTAAKEKGRIVGVQMILRDITKEKELFNTIEKSKKHFETIIDTIQDGICVINRNFQIESCNRAFILKIGQDYKFVKGRNCAEILPRYEAGLFSRHCARTVCNSTCGAEAVFSKGEIVSFVEKNEDKYGQMHYHQVNIYPAVTDQGEVNKAVMTIEDVTEKTLADEKVRRLNEFNMRILNNAPVSIMVIDKEGNIKSTNDYIRFISKTKDYLGKNIFKIPFFKEQGLESKYHRLLERGEKFAKENCLTISWSGEVKYLNIIAVPLKNEAGEIEGGISMAMDNTEAILSKKRIEKMNLELEKRIAERTWQLNKLNKELARVLELKSKFISDASHELRTPLTVIQGNLDLVASEARAGGGKVPEIYQTVSREVKHISNILSDLSMITHSDTNTENIAYDNIDVFDLVRGVAASLSVLAKKKNIKIDLEAAKAEQIMIKGDEAKLERLFLNIINNAIKYTKPGGEITIWLEVHGSMVVVNIKDTGIGIPQEHLPFIFERFYRVDKARSRQEGGTGLGLSICEIISKAHNGRISVESQVGKGTKFIIELPFDYRKRGCETSSNLRLFD